MRVISDAYSRSYFLHVLSVLFICIVLVNTELPANYRLPLLIVASIIGVSSVYGSFTLISSSIVIPSVVLPLTTTQFVLIIWVIGWFILQSDRKIYISNLSIILIIPFVMWVAISAAVTCDTTMLQEIIKAFTVAFIAYHILSLKGARTELILFSIFLGTFLSAVPFYYGIFFDLPGFEVYQSSENTIFYSQIGLMRYSTAKQDPNAVSFLLNLTFWGMFNLGMRARTLNLPISRNWLFIIAVACLPPMIIAQSRALFVVFGITSILTIFFGIFEKFKFSSENNLSTFKYRKIHDKLSTFFFIIIVIVTIIFIINYLIEYKWITMINSIIELLLHRGLDDRLLRFSEAWNYIKTYPLFGSGTISFLNSNVLAPHNIFLDIGIASGFPGIFTFIMVLFLPISFYFHKPTLITRNVSVVMISYLSSLFFMLSLSMIGDKTFWCLWSILIYLIRKKK